MKAINPPHYTINIKGELIDMQKPLVMGILNATPDSFYENSRVEKEEAIYERAKQIVDEGGKIIDVGACSTRPGGTPVSEEEEICRLRRALPIVKEAAPEAIISVDTFRASVARMAIEDYKVDIINDVAEGNDKDMFATVASLNTPYILMSVAADLKTMLKSFAQKIEKLHLLGQKDIILDPGFGFGKDLDENYQILNEMDKLFVLKLPILVGISRKRMIHQLLNITPQESLNGTTVLNTLALMKGASILRVHDVKQAIETVKIVEKMKSSCNV